MFPRVRALTGPSLRVALTASSGSGRGGGGQGSHLSLWIFAIVKDLIAFFSMCTYLFMYFCLFLFHFIHPSFDKGQLQRFQRLTREESALLCAYFPNPKFRPEMSGIGQILQVQVFSGCTRTRPQHTLFFYRMKHIALYQSDILYVTVCKCLSLLLCY